MPVLDLGDGVRGDAERSVSAHPRGKLRPGQELDLSHAHQPVAVYGHSCPGAPDSCCPDLGITCHEVHHIL